MNRVVNFATISTLMLLSGCLTIRSRVQHESVPQIKRILVVTQTRKPQPSYDLSFRRALPVGYEICTINLDRLSLNNNATIQEEARRCNSDAILTIVSTYRGNLLVNLESRDDRPGAGQAEFNLEMRSVTEKAPFWRATVSTSSLWGEKLPPRTLVRRLLQDGILEGKLPNVQQSGNSSQVASSFTDQNRP